MKTCRERINDCNTHIVNDYYVLESDVNGMLDEIESKVGEIIMDLRHDYDVKSALEKLEQLAKELY